MNSFKNISGRTLNKNCQLLKWIGNKQRFAQEIISYFPESFNRYYEPFLGSGAILASLQPKTGIGSDIFKPLIEIFQTLKSNPDQLVSWYEERIRLESVLGKKEAYSKILADFNRHHNGADFLYLSRTCYGGVVRFRKSDGHMSTPMGTHNAIPVEVFAKRVKVWHERVLNTEFICADYRVVLQQVKHHDMVYLDPPYQDSQSIIYGAQSFDLSVLFETIGELKSRGAYVALSIDGTKKSGGKRIDLPIPHDLFEREVLIENGRSMLRRFQMKGQSLESEVVTERLLLTY